MLMLWAEVVPLTVTVLSVELTVKAPLLAVTAADATVVFAERVTPLGAETALVRLMLAPLEVIEALPPEEVSVPDVDPEVGFVIAPEPDKAMFPVAVTGPETATVEPPLTETTPPDAPSAAVPVYVVVGVIRIAAALIAPEPTSTEPELEIPTSPPVDIVCVVLEKDLDVPVEVMVTLPLVESMFELRSNVPPSIATLPTV
jgi:hypothetical protein